MVRGVGVFEGLLRNMIRNEEESELVRGRMLRRPPEL